MASKRTKGKKKVSSRKVTRKSATTRGKRRTGKATKKPRKAVAKTGTERALESLGALNLLRAWSPSRYSMR